MLTFVAIIAVLGLAACACNAEGALEFPATIKRCPAGDTECLANLITALMAGSAQGIPELGLPSLDPLYFGTGSLRQQGSPTMNINLTINDGWIHGWSKMSVQKVVGFDKDPKTSQFELHVRVPVDTIVGVYDLRGVALLIPIKSSGAINMTFENLDMVLKFKTDFKTGEDGEVYLELQKIDLQIKAEKMHSRFENLFGDKAITDNANALMNQYQAVLFQETRSSFGEARAVILERFLRPVLAKYPYRMWYAPATSPSSSA